MTLGLLEAAISALESYLDANMGAKLDALDTEYGDFALDDIATYYQGALPREMPEYPSICLHGEAWEPEEQRHLNLLVSSSVNIIIFVGDPDEAVRFKKLCRYARAVVELLQEGEATYGYEHVLEGRIEPSDSLATPPFLQAIVVPVSLKKLESY